MNRFESNKTLRCKVGDLAVVIRAHHKSNIGKIVRVVAPYSHSEAAWLAGRHDHFDWIVECPTPLVWSQDEPYKRWRRKRGPVPDAVLQPIRDQDKGEQEPQTEPLPIEERQPVTADGH